MFCGFLPANICDTPAKAVEKLMQDNLLPQVPPDANEFRVKFLYTEEIGDIFAEHVVLVRQSSSSKYRSNYLFNVCVVVLQLQDIYNANMGRFCKPGEKKGMQLIEFLTVMYVFLDSISKNPFFSLKTDA